MLGTLTRSAVRRVLMIVAAVLVVLLVGISRIYLRGHAPADVLGGWALGTLWVFGVLAADRQRWERRPVRDSGVGREEVPA